MQSKSLTLKSEIHELNRVVEFIETICDENNIYNHYFGNILTAVSEAVQNAVEHGNKNDLLKSVTLDYTTIAKGFRFTITDQGNGFDYSSVQDPTDVFANDGSQGRGIFTIKNLSDNTSFSNNGATIIIDFYISSINKELSDKRIEHLNSFNLKDVGIKLNQ